MCAPLLLVRKQEGRDALDEWAACPRSWQTGWHGEGGIVSAQSVGENLSSNCSKSDLGWRVADYPSMDIKAYLNLLMPLCGLLYHTSGCDITVDCLQGREAAVYRGERKF
jgi:hypothetical protein